MKLRDLQKAEQHMDLQSTSCQRIYAWRPAVPQLPPLQHDPWQQFPLRVALRSPTLPPFSQGGSLGCQWVLLNGLWVCPGPKQVICCFCGVRACCREGGCVCWRAPLRRPASPNGVPAPMCTSKACARCYLKLSCHVCGMSPGLEASAASHVGP